MVFKHIVSMAKPHSITAALWEMGVTHKRDEWSHTDSCHALYYAGRMIGRYSAFQVSKLLEEHGLSGSDALIHDEREASK